MEAAIISEKGRRSKMEDSSFLDLNFAKKGWVFGGIYDGHGGKFTAKYAGEKLDQKFLEKLLFGLSAREAFIETYQEISEELKNQKSGSTAVNFLIKNGEIFTANIGDSRIIVIGEEGFTQLTVDHRVSNPEERERVKKVGGRIFSSYLIKGFKGVMNTRAFGDQQFRSVGVISVPFLNQYRISREDIILLAACDGLFDFMSNEEVASLVREFPEPNQLVEALKKEVLINRRGTDNLTIVVVSLKNLLEIKLKSTGN